MKKSVWFILAVFVFLLTGYAAFADDEMQVRTELYKQSRTLFSEGRFAELNALAEKYRKEDERTPSGVWKLKLFYSGLPIPKAKGDDPLWQTLEATYLKWIQEHPSPMAYIGYAKILIAHGWAYRGEGYAATVSDENWKRFFSYTSMAREYLLQHREYASVDPEFYTTMIQLAMAEQWPKESALKLFAEALQKHKYYYEIYFSIIVYLAPKWGGDIQKMEDFVNSAVAHTEDKEGKGLYARIYWYVSQCRCVVTANIFQTTLVDWPKMKTGINDVLKLYPDQWNINNFAFFACMAQDRPMTKALIDKIQTPIKAAWQYEDSVYPDYFAHCTDWAHRTD